MNYKSILTDFLPNDHKFVKEINSSGLKRFTILDDPLMSSGKRRLNHADYLNGSIIEFKDKYLFCYRTEQEPKFHHPLIHLVELKYCETNDTFLPVGDNFTLDTPMKTYGWMYSFKEKLNDTTHRGEDPRLFIYKNSLYVIFCDGFKQYISKVDVSFSKKKTISKVSNSKPVLIKSPLINHPDHDGREKNWMPMVMDDQVFIIYRFDPVIVFTLDMDTFQLTEDYPIVKEHTSLRWNYGHFRGGAPPIKYNDEWLFITHNVIRVNNAAVYLMSALTMDEEFNILRRSKYPIMIPILDGRTKPVIYPAGIVDLGERFAISFGYADISNQILFLCKDVLENNLAEPLTIQLDGIKKTNEYQFNYR